MIQPAKTLTHANFWDTKSGTAISSGKSNCNKELSDPLLHERCLHLLRTSQVLQAFHRPLQMQVSGPDKDDITGLGRL